MKVWRCRLLALVALGCAGPSALAQNRTEDACPRPAAGSVVSEPEDLRSQNGVLSVELTYRTSVQENGSVRYCYLAKDGGEAPTLRVKPGDLVILRLKNDLPADRSAVSASPAAASPRPAKAGSHQMPMAGECAGIEMTAASTNVHFHGLDLPPVCHQDDVLNTMIEPGSRPFEYRFRIPPSEPPGLYWYHPHVHGFSKAQVLGGASGALIVEGIERANTSLAGMQERVLVIRDQDLEHPEAQVPGPAPVATYDAEGDILNAGFDGGKPAKDLTINFVPVSFPDYRPAMIRVKPGEKQLWRVLNASAITYLDLAFMANNTQQAMGVVSLDGNPVDENGLSPNRIVWKSHMLLPPAGRAEFVLKAIPAGTPASLVTRVVDTGPAGENDPTRTLATIVSAKDEPETRSRLDSAPARLPKPASAWLGGVKPVRTRHLYFSEQPRDPADPNSPTDFYITVEGQAPALFDPSRKTPNIVARQGEVEDWIIENRTRELHAFHIHQIHFMLLEWDGVPLDEPFLRDTINVSYWDGVSKAYPSVKLRMDFRDPNVAGTFVYHCHLLEHEDGGMMGLIRVEPKIDAAKSRVAPSGRLPLCGRAEIASLRSRGHRSVTYAAASAAKQALSRSASPQRAPARNSF